MQRRMALAAALAFTTIVTFALVVTGARGGLFRSGNGSEDAAAAAEPSPDEIAGALQYLAAAAVPPVEEPSYVTEYLYVDEPAAAPIIRYVTAPSAGPPPAAQMPPLETGEPSPVATADPEQPVPTQPAPVATPTDAPPAPPPPGGSGPLDEDEFTGTVTAIDGDVVTFAHDGTTTDVRVTEDLERLDVGTQAKVHALLLTSGWIAKEIEVREGEDD